MPVFFDVVTSGKYASGFGDFYQQPNGRGQILKHMEIWERACLNIYTVPSAHRFAQLKLGDRSGGHTKPLRRSFAFRHVAPSPRGLT